MFSEFTSEYTVRGLTLDAVRRLTDLNWFEIDSPADAPTEGGVYGWFDPAAPNTMVYHGSGSGAGGLRKRLTNQLRWRVSQRARTAAFGSDSDEIAGYNLAAESPAIRENSERQLRLYVAIAEPVMLVDPTGLVMPDNAVEWETFIYAASHLAAGRRSILGGGAWENKSGKLPERMSGVAWRRMVELAADWRA